MPLNPTQYTFAFAGAVCLVCSVIVSSAAVGLRERQEANRLHDRRTNVLIAAGLVDIGARPSAEEVEAIFDERISPMVIDLKAGEELPDVDPDTFDPRAARRDPEMSESAPDNRAGIRRLPHRELVYYVYDENGEDIDLIVFPIQGDGLWSTLYGYIAVDSDTRTVRGLTYYEHGETPGLGGEVDNPRWQALWEGRKIYDEDWEPAVTVIKGSAGPPDENPHEVDGLAGATITGRGVQYMLRFWFGEHGFGPFLENLREDMGVANDAQAA